MKLLQEIIEQHPESVALVFRKYGLGNSYVTVENLVAACQQFGYQFVSDLTTEVVNKIQAS